MGGGGPRSAKEDKNPGPEAGPEHSANTRVDEPGMDPKSSVAEFVEGIFRLREMSQVPRGAPNRGPDRKE